MHITLKTILFLGFFLIQVGAFGQSKKLVKNFKLGNISYNLYQSHKASKSNNDTTFYLLYRAGKPKIIAKEIKAITEKSSGDTLASATFKINKNAIVFYQYSTESSFYHRIYTQNKNGLLSFKSNLIPAVRIEPLPPSVKPPHYDNTGNPEAVDFLPEFVGGMTALRKFLANNIEYPEEATEENIEGTVYAKFVVTKDGSIANIEIERKLGYGCDQEVIRVLKRMPKWRPAKLQGKEVNYLFRLPVKFALE